MKTQTVTVAGIHLGGTHTRRTAVVRASFRFTCEGSIADLKGSTDWSQSNVLKDLSVESSFSQPLLFDRILTNVGPSPRISGDNRLFQTLEDLGPCDLYSIDAPLQPPSCLVCNLKCPGVAECSVPLVKGLRGFTDSKGTAEFRKKSRTPLPYSDRYLDAFFRHEIEKTQPHLSATYGHDLEPALGSNRAPLFARAQHIRQRLAYLFPKAIVLESNGALSEAGWCNYVGSPFGGQGLSKNPAGGTGLRSTFVRRMEQSRLGMRHASLPSEVFLELEKSPSAFFAALAALSAWGLFQGLCFLPHEVGEIVRHHPLDGWICTPKASVKGREIH